MNKSLLSVARSFHIMDASLLPKLRGRGYDVKKTFSTYRCPGGCDNLGFAIFEESMDGLREAATLAQDMERAGFGREGWNGGQSESLVEADGSKILFAWKPTEQVRTRGVLLTVGFAWWAAHPGSICVGSMLQIVNLFCTHGSQLGR
jgi:hypothetical protein